MRRFIKISFVYMTLLLFVGLHLGALEWNFQTPTKDWTPATGTWEIKDGEYVQLKRGIPAVRTFAGDPNWTDYTVETKIKILENSYAGLIFRAQSELEYHVFYINVNENVCEWWHHTKPNPDSRVMHFKQPPAKVKIELNKQYTLKVVAQGEQFSFYINDIEQKVDKSDIYPAGRIGLWAWDTVVSFDDVRVSGKGIPESSAVSADLKLPCAWAKVKTNL